MTDTTVTRNYGLDILRVIACYMVIQIHTGEFYYIGDRGNVLNTLDANWVCWYNSLCRICVPLFVMISGFFLFPVKDASVFFKKRFSRVAIPFILWCVLYAFYFYFRGDATLNATVTNIVHIPVNYGVEIGHLWFVYMLLGIYLFAPVLSPWIQTASRKSMEFYLLLWCIAFCIPYIHLIFPAIWGEAFWNHTPMLYYFSGFMGYVVLANYIKRFHMEPARWNYVAGIALLVVGYGITAVGFSMRLPTEKFVNTLELTWSFETINIAMMTAGVFLMVKNIQIKNTGSAILKLVADISAKSYGIYLAHIMVLNVVHAFWDGRLASAAVKLPVIAACTFAITFIVIKILSFIPKSKWLIG
ncbi:acyltransferase [Mucilaginibacter gotjawali]|uniref:Surface polysaccharide O-acyltransferase-like enzyme n=1 Tax=Mucilaginibacter gotjawali TaxID=1550579 RepID=A0A839SR69_9SPHI|nr:acyltransferase family protein [Mucilaginibacter gotjawali]MBB3058949.1 surface polysaccharide O-acyltransferase-like enzyme [Mucilaginibacter gotjawali]